MTWVVLISRVVLLNIFDVNWLLALKLLIACGATRAPERTQNGYTNALNSFNWLSADLVRYSEMARAIQTQTSRWLWFSGTDTRSLVVFSWTKIAWTTTRLERNVSMTISNNEWFKSLQLTNRLHAPIYPDMGRFQLVEKFRFELSDITSAE